MRLFLKVAMVPLMRSAQSLGRNVFPWVVIPSITILLSFDLVIPMALWEQYDKYSIIPNISENAVYYPPEIIKRGLNNATKRRSFRNLFAT